MKIGIYGDSFASEYKGWPSIFQKLTNHKVEVLGVQASSVGYSYLKFLETHEKYDRIIFLWTQHQRNWLVSSSDNGQILKHYTSFIPRYTIGQVLKYHNNDHHSRDDYEPLSNELKDWIKNEKHNSSLYESKNLLSVLAMRDSVKLKRPDCLNIEAFDFFEMDKIKITSKKIPGMWRIQLHDMAQFSNQILPEDPYRRYNHLTFIQNVEFAKYLVKSFEDSTVDIHETFKNPKDYYTMSETFEQSGFEHRPSEWDDNP